MERTQEIQRERYKNEEFSFNGEWMGGSVEKYCVMTSEGRNTSGAGIYTVSVQLPGLYHKILKVATDSCRYGKF